MTKRYVLFLSPYFFDSISAASSYQVNLANGISSYHDVIFCHHNVVHELNPLIRQWPIYGSRISKFFGVRFTSFFLLVLAFVSGRVDVITDLNPCIDIFSSRITLFHIIHHINDIPSLPNLFDNQSMYINNSLMNKFVKSIWKVFLLTSPKEVLTVSRTVASDISLINSTKNITIIRNSNQIELDIPLPATTQPVKCSYDLLMIGHNVPRKNYSFAIQVINKLQRNFVRPLRVVFVGSDVASLCSQFDARVKFSSFSNISRDHLLNILEHSHIFLNTSLLEGYCIPFIEAQYIGLTCIVPNFPIFHENHFNSSVHYCDISLQDYFTTILQLLGECDPLIIPPRSAFAPSRYEPMSRGRLNHDIADFAQRI